MDDYVSRYAVIQSIKEHLERMQTGNEIYALAHQHLIEVVERIPAADVVEVLRCVSIEEG